MTSILATFKKAGRAAVIALALGSASLTAAPALAQSGPAFNFQLDLGNGSVEFGTQERGGFYEGDDFRRCLSDRQIRRGLRAHGFDNVDIRRDIGRNRVEARGTYGRWLYSMRVNRCSGRVDRVERLRPAFRGNGGGFGLHFDFGN